jgi:hypothetical protein
VVAAAAGDREIGVMVASRKFDNAGGLSGVYADVEGVTCFSL